MIFLTLEIADMNLLDLKDSGYIFKKKDLLNLVLVLIPLLSELNKNGIAHRDIKPQNILIIKKDDELKYKLTDFGVAKKFIKG